MRIELPSNQENDSGKSTLTPVTDLSSGHEKMHNPTRGMTTKQKIGYYSTYYLPKILAFSSITAFIIIFLVLVFSKQTDKISIMLVNHYDSYADDFNARMNEYRQARGYSEKETIKVDASHNFDLTNMISIEAKEAFSATLSSREFTLFFADEQVFKGCANETYFRYLDEYLPADLIERYKDDIIMGYDDETDSDYACGIRLTRQNCPFLVNTTYEECCFGVLFSNPKAETFQDLIIYILNWKSEE